MDDAQQRLTERRRDLAAVDHDVLVPRRGLSALPAPIVAALYIGLHVASGEVGIAQRSQLPGMCGPLCMDVHPHRAWRRTTASLARPSTRAVHPQTQVPRLLAIVLATSATETRRSSCNPS